MKKIKLLIFCVILLQMLSPVWAQYDYSYIPYRKGNKWGYCDSTKKVLIKPAYDKVDEIFYVKEMYDPTTKFIDIGKENKFAIVTNKNKEGIIDTTGRLIIPCKYHYFSFSGLNTITFMDKKSFFSYNVSDKKTTKLYDIGKMDALKESRIVIGYYEAEKIKRGVVKIVHYKPEKFKDEYISQRVDSIIIKADTVLFSSNTDTTFRIKDKNKWGLASFTQNIFLPAQYDSLIELLKNKIYALKEGRKWIIYNKTNNVEKFTDVGTDFFKVIRFSPFYFLTKRNAKFGLLNNDYNTIVPFEYDSLLFQSSEDTWMAGKVSDKWRIYDIKSNQPIDTNLFNEVRLDKVSNNQFLVRKQHTWYIYTGKKDMEYIYPHLKPHDGYRIIFKERIIAIIDKKRNIIGYASFSGLNYWDD